MARFIFSVIVALVLINYNSVNGASRVRRSPSPFGVGVFGVGGVIGGFGGYHPGFGWHGPPPGYGWHGPPPGYGWHGPPSGYGWHGPPVGYGWHPPPPVFYPKPYPYSGYGGPGYGHGGNPGGLSFSESQSFSVGNGGLSGASSNAGSYG